ncbi:DUF1800 domain-containing protein [Methylopila sp. M107]|uniref:DUF1800 domain-containing protein n=1 Tax=Methylopila sp. M107 TaxID=1101190 RepID=UPI000361CDD9|nr:DUF1800 domain-containing protein [Methylopila sp. M107]
MAMDVDDRRSASAARALGRFGLGARPGDLKRVASDPRGAVRAEMMAPDVALLPDPYLVSSADYARAYHERKALKQLLSGREVQKSRNVVIDAMRADGRLSAETIRAVASAKTAAAKPAAMADDPAMDGPDEPRMGAMDGGMDARSAPQKPGKAERLDRDALKHAGAPDLPVQPLSDEMAARFVRVRNADIGFVERLVSFWADHLTVSSRVAAYLRWVVGAYEREAIRPHVFGRFEDMLLASARHSAMMRFLDSQNSIGPNSAVGRRGRKGLNENYAREVMELHTVGVSAGYSQQDVIALAKALTGWTIEKRYKETNVSAFEYRPEAHEPGDQRILGKLYKDGGVEQGEAALRDLARHPATARRVAERLATAFVSDAPPPALVDRLERSFNDTGGDLKELASTLIASDEAWDAAPAKMRSPQEFVFATIRLVNRQPDPDRLISALDTLGQPMWGATSPKGYSIVGRDWIAPDAQTNRLDFAVDLARDYADSIDPNARAEDVLGAEMSDETRTAVKRAGSREQALALLIMSPEMQRR